MKTVPVVTRALREVVDVTDLARGLAAAEAPAKGEAIALLWIPHTTAVLLVSELDAELGRDILRVAERWLAGARPFQHIRKNNPNTEAHVLSAFGGASVALPVADGALLLGEFQRILLVELDGPKTRTLGCLAVAGAPRARNGEAP
jgi:secondary thiamine-phosphate synthase enzyme